LARGLWRHVAEKAAVRNGKWKRGFRRRYITLQGYKDGRYGLLLSLLMAYYEGVKYLKLWRLQRRGA